MTGSDAPAPGAGLALVIETARAKAVKDALKSARLLDLSRQAQPVPPSSVALPCVAGAQDLAPPEVTAALAAGVAAWRDDVGLASRKQTAAPAAALLDAVRVLLHASDLPESLLTDLPHRWERLGDLALLPADCMCGSWPAPVLERLYPMVAACLGVKRLARQAPIDPGPRRSSRAVLLWPPGADGWTTVTENGIPLCLDVTQSMFSSGNATEKHRMARLPAAAGETVVDLFAGIGYWALPLLVHAKVAMLYACEWNPPSIDALRRNLVLNAIPPSRCLVLPGDCRVIAPKGIAHRVLLGLLPDAVVGYAAAVEALRPDTGGVLHVHGNVRAGELATWAEATGAELQRLAAALGGARAAWQARVLHVEVVKSYAPRVLHCVADIRLGPPTPRLPALRVMELDAPSAGHMHGTAIATRTPARLTGLDCGPCVQQWSAAYLRTHADASRTVAVHVSDDGYLTWHPKNFVLRTMTLAELLDMCAAGKHVYMRAVGADPRSEPACLATSFPGLSADFELPACCLPPSGREVHSTVLRIAAPGMALWLHYDALDNILLQLHGTKRLLLFPPHSADGLYLSGSSSRVPTRLVWLPSGDASAQDAFPLFPGADGAFEVALAPGQGVFIPRYWAHTVLAGDSDISVAVNCFWHPPPGEPRVNGDVYGNADPPAASHALQAAREAAAALAQLPPDAQAFFASVAAGILRV